MDIISPRKAPSERVQRTLTLDQVKWLLFVIKRVKYNTLFIVAILRATRPKQDTSPKSPPSSDKREQTTTQELFLE